MTEKNIPPEVAHSIRFTCGPVWIFTEDHLGPVHRDKARKEQTDRRDTPSSQLQCSDSNAGSYMVNIEPGTPCCMYVAHWCVCVCRLCKYKSVNKHPLCFRLCWQQARYAKKHTFPDFEVPVMAQP